MSAKEGRDLTGRPARDDVHESLYFVEIPDRQRRVDGIGKSKANGLVGNLEPTPEYLVDRPKRRREGGSEVSLCKGDPALSGGVYATILDVVALAVIGALGELLPGAPKLPPKSIQERQPDAELAALPRLVCTGF